MDMARLVVRDEPDTLIGERDGGECDLRQRGAMRQGTERTMGTAIMV